MLSNRGTSLGERAEPAVVVQSGAVALALRMTGTRGLICEGYVTVERNAEEGSVKCTSFDAKTIFASIYAGTKAVGLLST